MNAWVNFYWADFLKKQSNDHLKSYLRLNDTWYHYAIKIDEYRNPGLEKFPYPEVIEKIEERVKDYFDQPDPDKVRALENSFFEYAKAYLEKCKEVDSLYAEISGLAETHDDHKHDITCDECSQLISNTRKQALEEGAKDS